MGSIVLTVAGIRGTLQRNRAMFKFEMKSFRMRKKMSTLRQKIMKHFPGRKNECISTREEGKKDENSSLLVFLDISGEYMRTGSVDDSPAITTSTPTRRHRRQNIVILHHISHLKIYEDFDDIDHLDISEVSPYEENDDEATYLGLEDFKIYENISMDY